MTNFVGIDIERALCSATLCEVHSNGRISCRAIGDGRSSLFPIALNGDGLWASAALLSTASRKSAFPPDSAGLWPDGESLERFAHHIYDRIYRYLGRVHPTMENGYEVLFTTPRQLDLPRGLALLEKAGFRVVGTVPGTDALLSAWLSSEPSILPSDVAVVVLGDAHISLRSYQLQKSAGCIALRESSGEATEDAGEAMWRRDIIQEIHARLSEPPSSSWEWLMHEACWRFGQTLQFGQNHAPVQWKDFLHERLAWPFRLAESDIATWSGLSFIKTSIRSLPSPPSLIVLGGPGTRWPYVRTQLSQLAPVWISEAPGEELSAGAALWRNLQTSVEWPLASSAPANPSQETDVPGTESRNVPPVLPPWQRRQTSKEEDD